MRTPATHADEPLRLDADRYFDSDPVIRSVARELYESVRALPLICPHGHVDPAILAGNEPFPEPASLIVIPDHYILRMLYSQGVPLDSLGVRRRGAASIDIDARRVWQRFGDHYHLFRGTPTGAWLNHELYDVFGVRVKLTGATAQRIYDEIAEKLQSPEFLPRALFDRFNIEVLATTDAATDELEHHRAIRASGWRGRVVPCFRPDALLKIGSADWAGAVEKLGALSGANVGSYDGYIQALEERRAYFRSLGATATDHGVTEPRITRMSDESAARLYGRALRGEATAEDEAQFEAHMMMEMARMSVADGMVMQLHAGSFRDHNHELYARYGPNVGGDIPLRVEFTRNLQELLNRHGTDPRFRLVLFTLDESTYARELAPLAGHYPALRLGPPWWFHDSIQGMIRFRQQTMETAGIHNTAGFNDDTRAFCSIPARHDLARRVDANYLAGLVAQHVVDHNDAIAMMRALAYELARETYRLDVTEKSVA